MWADYHATHSWRDGTVTTNVSIINLLDGRTVVTSYGVPVAVYVPLDFAHDYTKSTVVAEWIRAYGVPRGYVKTDRKYSTTTSRHANLLARRNGLDSATPIPHAVFRALVNPVVCAE